MSKYVDGFVLVVPKDKSAEYKKMAEMGRDAWMKNGALSYFECKGNDLVPPVMGGESMRSFPDLAGASSTEEVWFSFITFKSKEHRDQVNKIVMEEMSQLGTDNGEMIMPLDMKRAAYGGFQVEVEG